MSDEPKPDVPFARIDAQQPDRSLSALLEGMHKSH